MGLLPDIFNDMIIVNTLQHCHNTRQKVLYKIK